MSSQISGLRELGEAIGRSHTTAGNWTNHHEWPFSRTGPWSASQVDEMKQWAQETLRPESGISAIEQDNREEPVWIEAYWNAERARHHVKFQHGEQVASALTELTATLIAYEFRAISAAATARTARKLGHSPAPKMRPSYWKRIHLKMHEYGEDDSMTEANDEAANRHIDEQFGGREKWARLSTCYLWQEQRRTKNKSARKKQEPTHADCV